MFPPIIIAVMFIVILLYSKHKSPSSFSRKLVEPDGRSCCNRYVCL